MPGTNRKLRANASSFSVPQRPHHPARHNQSAHEHGEAVEAVTNLFARNFALRDSENHRSKNREQQGGVEMGESEDQDFFPMAMW